MKKHHLKTILFASPLVFSLSGCGMHYQKAITLDEGRTLLNNAATIIGEFDPSSRITYSFSLRKENIEGYINDERVTSFDQLSGTYNYDANTTSTTTPPWSTFSLECDRTTKEEGEGETSHQYLLRMDSASSYEILVGEAYEDYVVGTYPFLENYFVNYPSEIYKTVSQSLTSYLIEEMRNVGVSGQSNDLFGYTCLSTGNNDLVLILQSWDFSSLKNILSYADAFSDSEGSRDSFSSINFLEAHYEGGYLTDLTVGYDQEVDEEMKEEGLENRAKNIEDSYQVKLSF